MPLSTLQLVLRGAPFIAFVAGGSYVLAQFTQGTVEARDVKNKSRSVRAFKIEEEHAPRRRRERSREP